MFVPKIRLKDKRTSSVKAAAQLATLFPSVSVQDPYLRCTYVLIYDTVECRFICSWDLAVPPPRDPARDKDLRKNNKERFLDAISVNTAVVCYQVSWIKASLFTHQFMFILGPRWNLVRRFKFILCAGEAMLSSGKIWSENHISPNEWSLYTIKNVLPFI